MTITQSNEHLCVCDSSAWNANRVGTLDPTRTYLNFEIGKGGNVKEVDQKNIHVKTIKAILASHGVSNPNTGFNRRRKVTVSERMPTSSLKAPEKS